MSREKNCPSYSQDNIESAIMHYILSNGQTDKVAEAEKMSANTLNKWVSLAKADGSYWRLEQRVNDLVTSSLRSASMQMLEAVLLLPRRAHIKSEHCRSWRPSAVLSRGSAASMVART